MENTQKVNVAEELNAIYGSEFEEYAEETAYVPETPEEVIMHQENVRLDNILNDVYDECWYTLKAEAVEDFMAAYTMDKEDDGRYFYNMRELKEFLKAYLDAGGKLKKIFCGRVYTDDSHEFVCYEIGNRKYRRDERYEKFYSSEEGRDVNLEEVI